VKRLAFALAASWLSIASCATISTPSVETAAHISTAIDRTQAAYDRIALAAEVVLPFVSDDRAARIRLGMALAERGLMAARLAATATEQLGALQQAEAATAEIETIAAGPR
jgi:hypothetical protein